MLRLTRRFAAEARSLKRVAGALRRVRQGVSGIQVTDQRCGPVKPLDSRPLREHAGTTWPTRYLNAIGL